MKRTISCVLAGLMVTQSVPLFAQDSNSGGGTPGYILGGGSGKTNVYNAAGDYNHNQLNEELATISAQAFANLKDVQTIDREYMKGLAERYNNLLNELSNLKKSFQKLGLESQMGRKSTDQNADKYVTLSEYVQLVLEINNKDQILKNEIQTLSLMTRESLPSYSPSSVNNRKIEGVTSGNVDTKALVSRVDELRSQIIGDINKVKFSNLRAAANQFKNITENSLSPDLSGLRILEEADRERLTKEMNDKRILEEDTVKAHQRMVDKTVNVINTYISSYGTEEWLRLRNENDVKAAKESYMNIVDAFMRRSYLRKKYGIRIGAIQSKAYDKNILAWEKYGLQYQPLKAAVGALRRDAAIEQEDVNKAFENARNFLELYDEKTTEVFGKRDDILNKDIKKEEYSSKDTGFLIRANSAITFVTGQLATAEVLLAIMRLVLADAREEQLLFRNANDEVAMLSDARYRATDKMKVENNKQMCAMDWTIDPEVFQKRCPDLGVKFQPKQVVSVSATSGISDIFSYLLGQYKNIEEARWQEASNIQKQLDADKKSGYTTEQLQQKQQQDKEQSDDLFK